MGFTERSHLANAQAVEHHEICRYGAPLIAWAEELATTTTCAF